MSNAPFDPKIEKGVPLPGPRGGFWRDFLEKMEIGDSFVAPTNNIATTAQCQAKKLGQRIKATHIGNGQYRCWRVE